MKVIKRDGREVNFDGRKIEDAIMAAARASEDGFDPDRAKLIANDIRAYCECNKDTITINEIQRMVEDKLMVSGCSETARRYIIYRNTKDLEREKRSKQVQAFDEIIEVDGDSKIRNENANINACTPAGMMMKIASEASKEYAMKYLLNPLHAQAYRDGDFHPHDLDYYPTRSQTCCQINLDALFENGFSTNDGPVRSPKRISSYAALAAIVLQGNQNEMHGGQSIPAFDFYMAKGVKKEFIRQFKRAWYHKYGRKNGLVTKIIPVTEMYIGNQELIDGHPDLYEIALEDTQEETKQAMEAFVYNMVNMHSRGGAQVVFASVNYGTDTSIEGRMIMEYILDVTDKGAGDGSTFTFPIQIFKVKNGVSWSDKDFELAVRNIDKAIAGELKFEAPNFDLFIKSCRVSARRLFPNFSFLDSSFNINEMWDIVDPKRWYWEIAYMGCRTRVFDDLFYGEKSTISRGNLSFSTINIVRLAIKAKLEAMDSYKGMIETAGYEAVKFDVEAFAIKRYFEYLTEMLDMTKDQLLARYEFQRKAKAAQFPFLMGQGIWKRGEALNPTDNVGDILKTGSLSIGFIGLAEALVALIDEHHGESERAQELGLKIVGYMRHKCDEYSKQYGLNFSLLATPAEGLSGRFTMLDRKKYGVIPGVTDRDFYTNSNHVPVYYKTTVWNKVRAEGPYHKLTNAGHIFYAEMDGEAKKNLPGYMKIVKFMKDNDIGYGAINHPVDRCTQCSYEGVIEGDCPKCHADESFIDRIRRITGYLVGTINRWNPWKRAELEARVTHT